MVGVGRGVSHEFQRQMSPGQMPTMEACSGNDVQWEWEERELLPLTAMESTMVRALDGIPKEAPTMEAWILESVCIELGPLLPLRPRFLCCLLSLLASCCLGLALEVVLIPFF